MKAKEGISRRTFVRNSSAAALGLSSLPFIGCGKIGVSKPVKRDFGRLDFEVTTLGLGGQGALQWTPEGVDPVKIILKAYNLGVNYFDTSNAYGPSQANYGRAFRELNLVPGLPGYDERLRRSVFVTSKTMIKYGKGPYNTEDIWSWSDGGDSLRVADDIKRSVSELFGDGRGNYPDGACLDMMMIHNITSKSSIDAVFEGYDNPDPKDERIGALATLIDYREGTNMTGLNPGEEKLIRHLGFSGHKSPELMLNMIRRDHRDAFDGMLVALNANDRLYFNMQHNVLPVASAKKMGVIAMKIFSDGAMYSKEPVWSRTTEHLVHGVGSPELPSRFLVQYPLSTPGIHTAITGISDISDDETRCQLKQNFSAAQVSAGDLGASDRNEIEQRTAEIKNGETNYFQDAAVGLGPARNFRVEQISGNGDRKVLLKWDNAFAGREPIAHYEVLRDNRKIKQIEYRPQTTLTPFEIRDPLSDTGVHTYRIITVDTSGGRAESEILSTPTVS